MSPGRSEKPPAQIWKGWEEGEMGKGEEEWRSREWEKGMINAYL